MKCVWMNCISAVCLLSAADTTAAADFDGWQSSLITSVRKESPTYYNSQRLALDSQGRPHVIYVTGTQTADTLNYCRTDGNRWRHERVYTMHRTPGAISGLNGYALALDRKDQPHVYLYTMDTPNRNSIFEERWLFRQGGRWQNRVIRKSVNRQGGAGMHDPHLAIDGRGFLNVTAYVHSGYGTDHRARLRFFDGSSYHIDPLPRPPGKQDSKPSNLFIDHDDVIHIVYDSKKALHRGNADPGYPDSSVVYVTRRGNSWSAPEVIRKRVGPDPANTDYFVLSTGIFVDELGGVHVTYAAQKRGRGAPTEIYYVHRDATAWQEQLVATFPPPERGNFTTAVFGPAVDGHGRPHFAFDTPTGTTYVYRDGASWHSSQMDGELEGFGLDLRTGVHILVSSGTTVTHRRRALE